MLLSLELYVMLVLANGAPVVAARILGERWDQPVDGNRLWSDGRPMLGKSKTWRGLVSGCLACALFSLVAGLGFLFGALFGFLGLLGDMISSFIKRRMGLQSSARALGLDQIPEAALPMILATFWLPVGWESALLVVLPVSYTHLTLPTILRV